MQNAYFRFVTKLRSRTRQVVLVPQLPCALDIGLHLECHGGTTVILSSFVIVQSKQWKKTVYGQRGTIGTAANQDSRLCSSKVQPGGGILVAFGSEVKLVVVLVCELTRYFCRQNRKRVHELKVVFLSVCRGRLRHGRHFTYKSVLNDVAITLVSTSVLGSIADEQHPFAAHGPWLQVRIRRENGFLVARARLK